MRGRLIVLSAPSGGGKTSVRRAILSEEPSSRFSVSYTTRPRRPEEVEGVDYIFVTGEEFTRAIEDNKLAEWEQVHGNRYGTPRAEIERALEDGADLVLDIDVYGALAVREAYPVDTVTIFLKPPSLDVLMERLRKRNQDSEASLETRAQRIPKEMELAGKFDHIVVNDDFEEAVAHVLRIINGPGGNGKDGD